MRGGFIAGLIERRALSGVSPKSNRRPLVGGRAEFLSMPRLSVKSTPVSPSSMWHGGRELLPRKRRMTPALPRPTATRHATQAATSPRIPQGTSRDRISWLTILHFHCIISAMWIERQISDTLRKAAAQFPVVVLTGARQAG